MPVAGWYANPDNAEQLRWWDGTKWTDAISDAQHPGAAPAPAPAPATATASDPTPQTDSRGFFSRMMGVKSDAAKAAAVTYNGLLASVVDGSADPATFPAAIEAARSEAEISVKQDRSSRIETARALVDRVLADDYLSEDEDQEIFGSMEMMGLEPELFEGTLTDVSKSILIARANAGRLSPIDDSQMVAKAGEVVYLDVAAQMLKEVTIRQYKGGYGGVSFRVAKGVRFSTGAVRGKMVPVGTEIQVIDTGLLCISNKRAVFLGDKKTQEFSYDKLLGMKLFSDAITLQVSNRQNATTLGTTSPDLIAAYINAASQEHI